MVLRGVNTLIALAVVIGTGVVGEDFTMLSIIPYNFFCIGLIVVYWVADMTFTVVPTITEAIIERAKHPSFGYFFPTDKYYNPHYSVA